MSRKPRWAADAPTNAHGCLLTPQGRLATGTSRAALLAVLGKQAFVLGLGLLLVVAVVPTSTPAWGILASGVTGLGLAVTVTAGLAEVRRSRAVVREVRALGHRTLRDYVASQRP